MSLSVESPGKQGIVASISHQNNSPDKENQQEAFRQQKQKFLAKITAEIPKRSSSELKDFLHMNKTYVNFGQVIPGNICEDELAFQNLSNDTIIICLQIVCNNTEFDELDEYVYSARKINGYDYNDRFMLACPAMKQFSMKIALKVPNVKDQKGLHGTIMVTAQLSNHQKINGQINVQINSQITLPLIECPKTLLSAYYNLPVIQLAFKLGKKLDCKIPFRNNSSLPLPLECEFLNKTEGEIIITPSALSIQSNQQFLLTLFVKSKQEQIIKNVLILKVKNSNVHFSYPLIIKVY